MPQIRRVINRAQPTTQPGAAQVNPNIFAGEAEAQRQLGGAIRQAGGVASDISSRVLQQQQEREILAAKRAYNEWAIKSIDELAEDEDYQSLPRRTSDSFDKFANEHMKTVKNRAAKRSIKNMFGMQKDEVLIKASSEAKKREVQKSLSQIPDDMKLFVHERIKAVGDPEKKAQNDVIEKSYWDSKRDSGLLSANEIEVRQRRVDKMFDDQFEATARSVAIGIGIKSPRLAEQYLKATGLDEDTISSIMDDVNLQGEWVARKSEQKLSADIRLANEEARNLLDEGKLTVGYINEMPTGADKKAWKKALRSELQQGKTIKTDWSDFLKSAKEILGYLTSDSSSKQKEKIEEDLTKLRYNTRSVGHNEYEMLKKMIDKQIDVSTAINLQQIIEKKTSEYSTWYKPGLWESEAEPAAKLAIAAIGKVLNSDKPLMPNEIETYANETGNSIASNDSKAVNEVSSIMKRSDVPDDVKNMIRSARQNGWSDVDILNTEEVSRFINADSQ